MDDTSIQTRNRAVLSHLGLARHVSRQENQKGPESADDLFQEACLGLIRGMDQYNPNLGYKPSSYLVRRCRGQILHYRRDRARTIRIPWRLRDLAVKGQRLQETDRHDGKLNLQPKDIADALGVSLQRWEQAQLALQANEVSSLEGVQPPVNTQYSDREDPQRDWLRSALHQLDHRQQSLLQRHFNDGITLKELAETMLLPPSTIKRCLFNAIQLLRGLAAQSADVVIRR